ncbi:conserved hypothetical protein [Trichinella spiralis]|uniref:hypothetical protein n=1 Tax=Trichinella spiralis TaxID=6334 RepID=UPI0001EFE939|nr:conserved hypothetical protein [Trichinella spiralis]
MLRFSKHCVSIWQQRLRKAPSGARFIRAIYDTEVYYKQRGTRDYTKGYNTKVKQTGKRTPYHYCQCTHDTTTFVFFLSYPIKAHLMFRYNRHKNSPQKLKLHIEKFVLPKQPPHSAFYDRFHFTSFTSTREVTYSKNTWKSFRKQY